MRRICLEFDPHEEEALKEETQEEHFPAPITETVKVLGVLCDQFLTLDDNCGAVPHKAGLRHGILTGLARLRSGLETGILRIISTAIVTSLLRYGLVVTVGC